MKYDMIVVGAGPAGMTAALYALRAGKSLLLIEGQAYGGQIVQSQKVENYPGAPDISGWELAEQMMNQIRALGVKLVAGNVTGIEKNADGDFLVKTDADSYEARTVILATGVGHRKLGVAGEEALIGRGVSFCATCDGMFFRRREVAVVGGGNTAVQDALVLSELCAKVYLIHRRDGFRAEERLMERLRNTENVTLLTNTVVSEMKGDGRLESLLLRNVKTDATRELFVAGVFEAVGNLPRNAAFSDLVALDPDGYIVTDRDCRTSCEGIFAAGDCCQKAVRQLTTATADGTVAALSAIEYLG
ncbi:MAG: thioredoxin-disulfide reductase [Ruminococcaceae bacterium]|nr:thioredoxin-disulfide reductase [Oscillospiraceae bacterium]